MRKPDKKARTEGNPVQLPTLCIVRGCVQRATERDCLCVGCHSYLTTGNVDESLARHSRAHRLAVEEMSIVLLRRFRTLMLDEV
jgi:hypothetical protein